MGDEDQQEPTDNTGGQGSDEIKGHPAWDPILNQIPEEFHTILKPAFQDWDKGVQEKIQGLHSQYDPYKNLIENNVPYEAVDQALFLMHQLENNPSELVAKAIEQFGLEDFINKNDIEFVDDDEDEDDDDDEYEIDITSDPRFKALEETVNKLASTTQQREEAEKQSKAQEEFARGIEQLHEKYGEFDDVAVTAVMSTGMNGEQAVKWYQDTINQAAAKIAGQGNDSQQQIPVVMGGSGQSGSGLPEGSVKMGDLSKNDTDKLVAEMLEKAARG